MSFILFTNTKSTLNRLLPVGDSAYRKPWNRKITFELHALVVDEYNNGPMPGMVTERPLASHDESKISVDMEMVRIFDRWF